ncbi:hypothetical protein BC941DRAFT_424453 [Chlamydoabsidia padenii]|nr:hypothetical protein BC941DRAFT_424453 [Chlamydoabsidia padenii]
MNEDDDSDTDEQLKVLTDDVDDSTATPAETTDATTDDDKKNAKLETLENIKQQLEKIHESHQKVLASSLYFNDQQLQQHDNTTPADLAMVQVPTNSKNYDFLLYEDNIMRILLQLDNISSDGDESIRQQRKDLVKQAGMILDQLDQYKQSEWERQSSNSATSDDDDDDKHDHDHLAIVGSNYSDGSDSVTSIDQPLSSNNEQQSDTDSINGDNDSIDHLQDLELMDDIDENGFLILNL